MLFPAVYRKRNKSTRGGLRNSSGWDRNPDPPWREFSDKERTVPKSETWLLRVALLSRLLIQNFCSLESMRIRALIRKKMMYTVTFSLVSLEAVNPCRHPISVSSLAVNPSWSGLELGFTACEKKEISC